MSQGAKSPAAKEVKFQGFSRIRLLLAREPGHPEGSEEHGYELVVPLDGNSRIDARRWKDERASFRFVHFKPGAAHEVGHLVHKPGGTWSFLSDIRGDDAEAQGYRFQDERFRLGEYVSIREDDGLHTYRVTSVLPVVP